MKLDAVLQQLDVLTDAPNGIERIRELILRLAIQGRLVPQDSRDERASTLLERLGPVLEMTPVEGQEESGDVDYHAAEEDLPFSLPDGWCAARLGELLSFEYGKNLPAGQRFQTGTVPVYGSNGVVGYHDEALFAGPAIVVGRKGSAGALNLTTGAAWATDVAYYVVPPRWWDVRFAYRLLQALQLPQLGKGIKPGLSRRDAYQLRVALPPLPEQRRIVTKVDELMELCNELEARQRRRAEARVRLNRSLLHHLVTAAEDAELAASWQRLRENFELIYDTTETVAELRLLFVDLAVQGRLLRESIHSIQDTANDERREWNDDTLPRIPAHWRWVCIADLGADPANPVQTGPFGALLHKSEFVQSGVPVIAVGNLTGRGFKTDGLYYISPSKADALARYDVMHGDLLFARSGATLGKVCVAPDYVNDWRMTGHILRVRLNQSVANPHYLVYALWGAAVVREQVMAGVQGTTRPGYNTSLLERIVVPVPPRLEQDRLVEKLDELMALCDRLEGRIASARDRAGYLAASMVHYYSAA